MMNGKSIVRIHPKDNVAVALKDLSKDEQLAVEGTEIALKENIPGKHKVALTNLEKGSEILMYGILVGKATRKIQKGEVLSTANTTHDSREYAIRKVVRPVWQPPVVSGFADLQFQGYRRKDGKVGTANYWIVVPLVFCENRNLAFMKDAMLDELGYTKGNNYKWQVRELVQSYKRTQLTDNYSLPSKPVFGNIDGIKFLNHTMGCGGTPEDARSLCGLLAGYINHPNVAGATVLSLGCQDAQVKILLEELDKRNPKIDKPILLFEQQAYGTENELLSRAIEQTFNGLIEVNENRRTSVPLSKLVIGVECGGSDGFSGISANPAIGFVSDMITALKGTVILSEFPELCGVEQDLIERCVSPDIAQQFIELQSAYAKKAEQVGTGFYMNPSPGNIKDGLITDAMKSAGAVKKGGESPVVDVLDYPEQVTKSGLNLLCTPGNDVESTTALVGAGANLILFSTGLGTPTGNPITPVIKVSSNSKVAMKMHDIIDVDAGKIISGEERVEETAKRILYRCMEVASGRVQSKAVQNGQDDFIPWKRGISL
jgi:altronate hydrolase